MKVGVVVFPASNCARDTYWAFEEVLGSDTVYLWHKEKDLKGCDLIVLPGGFSYGDYLRTGAIAKFSPIMSEIDPFARDGGMVLGICNGFQVLQEAGLLNGVMLKNESLKFISTFINIKVERKDTPFTNQMREGEVLRIPIAHFEGNFFCEEEELEEIERKRVPAFRYCSPEGKVEKEANPNGSQHNIAGITNSEGNVLGMMPHPERACETILGSSDGLKILQSINAYIEDY